MTDNTLALCISMGILALLALSIRVPTRRTRPNKFESALKWRGNKVKQKKQGYKPAADSTGCAQSNIVHFDVALGDRIRCEVEDVALCLF